MAGPAQVKFPGEDKRRRVRMRGIKKASESIRKRLLGNLERLLDEPAHVLPEVAEGARRLRRDPLPRTLKDMRRTIERRNDRRWLRKRMVRRRGDHVSRALAGALLAANEEEHETVAIYQHAVYGETSYVRRGNGRPAHQASLQNQQDPRFRLLTWEEHARAGLWFFTIESGVHCSGADAIAPLGWVESGLEVASIPLQNEGDVWWSSGLDEKTVREGARTDRGWIRIEFNDGATLGLSSRSFRRGEEGFVPSIALRMLPPKLSAIASATWVWAPRGWPENRDIPSAANEKASEVVDAWLEMGVEDGEVVSRATAAAVAGWDEGVMVGDHWFESDGDWIDAVEGGDLEKEAVRAAFVGIEGGMHIRRDGVVLDVEDDVIRLEEIHANALLTALWDDYGAATVAEMFGLDEDEAIEVAGRPRRRGQGFNAFLKSLDDELGTRRRLARLPWGKEKPPGVLGFAHRLIRDSHSGGLAATMTKVRKREDDDEKALGWAWLVTHGRDQSEAWRFDQDARDKGADWVPALTALHAASLNAIGEENEGDGHAAYVDAMRALRTATGTIEPLPDP